MPKEKIPKEAGRLKWLCNEAFFGVKRILPRRIRDSERYDNVMAFLFGLGAGYGVAYSGECLIDLVNSYGANLPLERITSHCLAATASSPFIAYGIAPQYVKNFKRENPTYSSGALGVMIGASVKALETLLN